MDPYAQIVEKIIEGQEAIIGPVAVEQAEQVENLSVNWAEHTVSITGDALAVIDTLVKQYEGLFGRISVEVSKESASSLLKGLTPDQRPKALR